MAILEKNKQGEVHIDTLAPNHLADINSGIFKSTMIGGADGAGVVNGKVTGNISTGTRTGSV